MCESWGIGGASPQRLDTPPSRAREVICGAAGVGAQNVEDVIRGAPVRVSWKRRSGRWGAVVEWHVAIMLL